MPQDPRDLAAGMVETSHDALLALDAEGRITAWNWTAEVVFGHPRASALGQSWLELLVPPADRHAAAALLEEARATGSALAEGVRLRRDGSEVQVEVFARPLPGGCFAVSHKDVTDPKRMADQLYASNRELEEARRAAEAATRAKSEFLATMSHEIRTPMNAVIGMTSLLGQTELTAEQRDFVETIRTSGDHLLAIINDILDFSKIESGRLELEQHPFEVRAVVEEALDLVAARGAEKGLDLAYLLAPEVPVHLVGDAGRLRQVLVNLLGNAVKFTAHGEVVVSVASRNLPGGRHEVEFAVRDTGIGIPAERMGRLFQPFSQADASTTRIHGGTGLGLAISRRLVELMGGGIGVESTPGVGSTFRFQVVGEAVAAPVKVKVRGPAPELRGRRVLIVDDNATNRRILHLHALAWGLSPTEADGPRQALEHIRRGDPFDVVLLDFMMPGMDGAALAAEIRRERGVSTPPMMLLSSVNVRRDEPRIHAAGFAAVLTKPLKPSLVYDALVEVFALAPARGPVRGAPAPLPATPPLRILLAEDNLVNQKVALRMLQRLGYRADVAANGLEVLDAVQRQRYDVVFLDVQMPELDGLEAARRICAGQPKGQRPHLIAMTANALAGDREACLQAGMDDYVSKPVDLSQLAAALGRAPLPEA